MNGVPVRLPRHKKKLNSFLYTTAETKDKAHPHPLIRLGEGGVPVCRPLLRTLTNSSCYIDPLSTQAQYLAEDLLLNTHKPRLSLAYTVDDHGRF